MIEGEGIADGTYIDEIYYNGDSIEFDSITYEVPVIKLSAVATATKVAAQLFIGVTIGMQPTIAKGIQYLINSTSTAIPTNALASRSLGPSSKSFATSDQNIDNKYGMPAWFIKSLPVYQGGH